MTTPIKTSDDTIYINGKSYSVKKEKALEEKKSFSFCRICHKVAVRVFAEITNDWGERKILCSSDCMEKYMRSHKNSIDNKWMT